MMETQTNATWEDLCVIASGLDENKEPRSACVLSLDDISDKQNPNNITSVFLKTAELNLASAGGCIVAVLDMPLTMGTEYRMAREALSQYFSADDDNWVLSLLVNAYALEGAYPFLLQNPAFSDGYQTEDANGCDQGYPALHALRVKGMLSDPAPHKKYRLTIAFDHNASQVFKDDSVDFDRMVNEVAAEMARIDKEVEDELAEALLEEQKAKNGEVPGVSRPGVDYLKEFEEKFEENEDTQSSDNAPTDEHRYLSGNPNFRFTDE